MFTIKKTHDSEIKRLTARLYSAENNLAEEASENKELTETILRAIGEDGYRSIVLHNIQPTTNNVYDYSFKLPIIHKAKDEIKKLYPDGDIDMEVLTEQLLDFLVASSHNSINMYDKKVDILWHNFILDTEEYLSFCFKYFGKVIHHKPHSTEVVIVDNTVKEEARVLVDSVTEYRRRRNMAEYSFNHYDYYNNTLLYTLICSTYLEQDNSSIVEESSTSSYSSCISSFSSSFSSSSCSSCSSCSS